MNGLGCDEQSESSNMDKDSCCIVGWKGRGERGGCEELWAQTRQ